EKSWLSLCPLTPLPLSPAGGEGRVIDLTPSPVCGERVAEGRVRGRGPISKVFQTNNTRSAEPNRLFAAVQRPTTHLKPNVVLITIDTLRPDHLGCYGYKAIQTPNIDKLASESARFTSVVSQVPQTLPSHCSILTSTYPMFHRVRDNVGYRLDDSKTTLAKVL